MSKFYPEHDLSYVYRVEMEAQKMRAEEVARVVGVVFRAIKRGFKKLDMWFEASNQAYAVSPYTFTGLATGRYHLPAIFTDAEKVQVKPANQNDGQRAA
jgi:hypothetical protein